MPTVYDIPANILIRRLAQDLKSREEIAVPDWMPFAKTGAHRERGPDDPEFWYVRCASILRKIYLNGPIGTEKLRIAYGGKKRRGVKPNKFQKGSGSIVRTALQQLERAGFIKKQGNKGREMTDIGRSYMDKLSSTLKKELSQAIPELEKY
ncbi:MAG: 30S ribosomal protein S19 [Candidatus Thorarchaeota archaeon SMTZ-45]|nr:MAG: 30S ribosomal protein S19 [Candidatus Thorarchaeota archaeon SMTZ-45]KXH74105.1 MAG: 30S ribosomal protein S19 [Candidatus Thorarchaeota archaeon SMTZ1-45]